MGRLNSELGNALGKCLQSVFHAVLASSGGLRVQGSVVTGRAAHDTPS